VSDGVCVMILFKIGNCEGTEIEHKKLREQDLNLRPSGYEPDELPDCSIPRYQLYYMLMLWICQIVLEEWK
jgi:hypothetical protein